MPEAHEYEYIRAWGEVVRIPAGKIIDLCEKAARDNAPLTALFYMDGLQRWAVVTDMTHETQRLIIRDVERAREVIRTLGASPR